MRTPSRPPYRQLAEAELLDRAAAVIARQGAEKTSVQDVADAVGLSKAGLLHHFPTKDALLAAVVEHADGLAREVLDLVAPMPVGIGRDRRTVELLVDAALRSPGAIALMLAPITDLADPETATADRVAGTDRGMSGPKAALHAFGVEPDPDRPPVSGDDLVRLVRVVGALGALAVLSLAATHARAPSDWRPLVIATCLDTLGHPSSPAPGKA